LNFLLEGFAIISLVDVIIHKTISKRFIPDSR
jgi:hypothetical protein